MTYKDLTSLWAAVESRHHPVNTECTYNRLWATHSGCAAFVISVWAPCGPSMSVCCLVNFNSEFRPPVTHTHTHTHTALHQQGPTENEDGVWNGDWVINWERRRLNSPTVQTITHWNTNTRTLSHRPMTGKFNHSNWWLSPSLSISRWTKHVKEPLNHCFVFVSLIAVHTASWCWWSTRSQTLDILLQTVWIFTFWCKCAEWLPSTG